MSLHGIDVSSWQGGIKWPTVKSSGIDFAYLKATEGETDKDDLFNANHDGAKGVGLPCGAYHFFHFGQDPVAQARHFLATINGREGQLLPMVDVEGGGQDGVTDLSALTDALSDFLVEVEKTLDGKRMLIYADYGDWNGFMKGTDAFSGHPLWVAEYNNDPAPTLPNGWNDWVIWQHTSGGMVSGIMGPVDLDLTKASDLSALLRTGETA